MTRLSVPVIIFASIILLPGSVFASSLSGYAWSSNIGWIKFSGPGYGVQMEDATGNLSGYAWSSNIGWIKFGANGPEWARACAGAADTVNCVGAANSLAGGWDGWIKLRGANYGIVKDEDNCRLSGWAWGSDVIGWIRFAGANHQVRIDGCDNAPLVDAPVCSFSASPNKIAKGGRTNLNWNCGGTADFCSILELGVDNLPGTGTIVSPALMRTATFNLECANLGGASQFSTQVQVVRPAYCEVIPFIGGCR